MIFELRRFHGATCKHHLLSRVLLPNIEVGSHSSEDLSLAWAEERQRTLVLEFKSNFLPTVCTGSHKTELLGRMELLPFGDELYANETVSSLTIGYCGTDYGSPWIVIGIADSDGDFWSKLALPDNQDLRDCNSVPPACIETVRFVVDNSLPPAPLNRRTNFFANLWDRLLKR